MKAADRAKMPKGTQAVLDSRTLENDYPGIVPFLKPGMKVLDVGCGTGAITAGIAGKVGEKGLVVGIDNTAHLVAKGREDYRHLPQLQLLEADLYTYLPSEKFDLIVSARVLQWLEHPKKALQHFISLLNEGGMISILDYNHELIEWEPEPPQSFLQFYNAFLSWRADAGMDNLVANHLPGLFEELGLKEIEIYPADEICTSNQTGFIDKAGIWTKVAMLRGPQMIEHGFISPAACQQAADDYDRWLHSGAKSMIMRLKEIRGRI
ncbi:methyltransferase [Chitinophaga caeni]|uniref:Methyltransferase n=1 Tax=Chitinophaga caeni TaxID=2029983 RepID=A0A291QXY5_9BACT|nr:methyltransferase domain-containing protein [Chitinophaga caeni]ATL48724.1 methyltransferase [Chitinophaga caeni]